MPRGGVQAAVHAAAGEHAAGPPHHAPAAAHRDRRDRQPAVVVQRGQAHARSAGPVQAAALRPRLGQGADAGEQAQAGGGPPGAGGAVCRRARAAVDGDRRAAGQRPAEPQGGGHRGGAPALAPLAAARVRPPRARGVPRRAAPAAGALRRGGVPQPQPAHHGRGHLLRHLLHLAALAPPQLPAGVWLTHLRVLPSGRTWW
mmetsp:Transcript_42556/g.107580  ORF Transcript_42556/g.107580 Transcript_42556/m.107580 type:complete len:201 (+) Transcript_42556:295-897(+)